MIQSFGLEFDTEEEMLETAKKLWNVHKVTGEMEMVALPNGKWRLNIHSEKQLRDSTLEKLNGRLVTVKMDTVDPGVDEEEEEEMENELEDDSDDN